MNEENKKFTAIYYECWTIGSNRHVQAKMKRVELKEGETKLEMIEREEIEDLAFLFEGHPKMDGE